jgi:hypothetical protein
MPTEWFLSWFPWTVAVGHTSRMQRSMRKGLATALQTGRRSVVMHLFITVAVRDLLIYHESILQLPGV